MEETVKLLMSGKSLIFATKSETKEFAKNFGLELIYNDGEFIDEEHFEIKGMKGLIYWIH